MATFSGYYADKVDNPLSAIGTALRRVRIDWQKQVKRNLDEDSRRVLQRRLRNQVIGLSIRLREVAGAMQSFDRPRFWSPESQDWEETTPEDVARWKRMSEEKSDRLAAYYQDRVFRDGQNVKVDRKEVNRHAPIERNLAKAGDQREKSKRKDQAHDGNGKKRLSAKDVGSAGRARHARR